MLSIVLSAILFIYLFKGIPFFINVLISSVSGIYIYQILKYSIKKKIQKHYDFIKHPFAIKMLEEGFFIENVNSYQGISGQYRHFIFDIYYDFFAGAQSNESIALIIYFQPLQVEEGKIRMENRLDNVYYTNILNLHNYSYSWKNGSGTFYQGLKLFNKFPSKELLHDRLDHLVGIMNENNLQPIDRKTLVELRQMDQYIFQPQINIYT